MRVTTIDGGFRGLRGLGSISTERRIAVSQSLSVELDRANAALDRATLAATRGAMGSSELAELRTVHAALLGRVTGHLAELAMVTSESQFAEWNSTADVIRAELRAFERRALYLAGEGLALEPWKIALAATLGITVIGGIAYAISQR